MWSKAFIRLSRFVVSGMILTHGLAVSFLEVVILIVLVVLAQFTVVSFHRNVLLSGVIIYDFWEERLLNTIGVTKIDAHIIDVCSPSNGHCDVRLLHVFVYLIIFHLLRTAVFILDSSVEPTSNRSWRFIKGLRLLVSIISFFGLCFMDEGLTLARSVRHWKTLVLLQRRWHDHRGIIRRVLAVGHLLDRWNFHIFNPLISLLLILLWLWLFRRYYRRLIHLERTLHSPQIRVFHKNNTFVLFASSILGTFGDDLSNNLRWLRPSFNFGRLSKIARRRLEGSLLGTCHSGTLRCLDRWGLDFVLGWVVFCLGPQLLLNCDLSLFEGCFGGAPLLIRFLNAPMDLFVWKVLHFLFAYLSSPLRWMGPILGEFYFLVDVLRIIVPSVLARDIQMRFATTLEKGRLSDGGLGTV